MDKLKKSIDKDIKTIKDIDDFNKLQIIVDDYCSKCTIDGLFPLLYKPFFAITSFLILGIAFFELIVYIIDSINVNIPNSLVMIFFIVLIICQLLGVYVYFIIVSLIKKRYYIWHGDSNINFSSKLKMFLRVSHKTIESDFLRKAKDEFAAKYKIDDNLENIKNQLLLKELTQFKVDTFIVLSFFSAILTFMKISSEIELTNNVLLDIYNISYMLCVVIIPCFFLFTILQYAIYLINKKSESSSDYTSKKHYINFLKFLEERKKEMR